MKELIEHPEIGPQLRHAKELEIGLQMHPYHLQSVTKILLIALACPLFFNSESFLNWAMKLPAGSVGDSIVWVIGEWHELMELLGATHVFEYLRQAFRWFQFL